MLPVSRKPLVILRIIIWTVIFVAVVACAPSRPIVGSLETVKLRTPQGAVDVVAKMDSGADNSSLDQTLAASLGLQPTGEMNVITSQGRVRRNTVDITFMLGGRNIKATATLADRSNLSTQMLVGKNELAGFLIDVTREFVVSATPTSPTGTKGNQ